MSTVAEKKRTRMHELFRLWHAPARLSRETDHAACLRALQEDGIIVSPKVYESGIILRLNLRLVDLYGDCVIEKR